MSKMMIRAPRAHADPYLQDLVQLLLVFGEVEAGVGIVDQVLHLVGRVRRVDAVDHTAGT